MPRDFGKHLVSVWLGTLPFMSQRVRTIAQVIGGNARAIREDLAVSQEEVATRARRLGARWSQSTVADLEQGRRTLTLQNLFLLAATLSDLGAGAPPVRLADLVQADGAVEISDETVVSPGMLATMLGGEAAAQGVFFPVGTPGPDMSYSDALYEFVTASAGGAQELARAREAAGEMPQFELAAGPIPAPTDLLAVRSSFGLSDHRAAMRLGMLDAEAQHHMARLWGEALSARSDRLAEEESHGPASAQRRGGVTRRLSGELEEDRDLARALASAVPELVDASRDLSAEQWKLLARAADVWPQVGDGADLASESTAISLSDRDREELAQAQFLAVEKPAWITPQLLDVLGREVERWCSRGDGQ